MKCLILIIDAGSRTTEEEWSKSKFNSNSVRKFWEKCAKELPETELAQARCICTSFAQSQTLREAMDALWVSCLNNSTLRFTSPTDVPCSTSHARVQISPEMNMPEQERQGQREGTTLPMSSAADALAPSALMDERLQLKVLPIKVSPGSASQPAVRTCANFGFYSPTRSPATKGFLLSGN